MDVLVWVNNANYNSILAYCRRAGILFFFFSILSAQVFFELGLNQIVLQRLSRSYAHLKLDAKNGVTGPIKHVNKFLCIVQLSSAWYRNISILFFFTATIYGSYFLYTFDGMLVREWLPVLVILMLFVSLGIYQSIRLTIHQSMLRVAKVAKIRLIQSIVGYSILLIAIYYFDIGLIGAVILPLVSFLIIGIWLLINIKNNKQKFDLNTKVTWKKDFWPLQSRMALSWVAGYFTSQLMIPFVFQYHGPEIAGQLGLSIAIYSSILALSLSFIYSKIPSISVYISKGEYDKAYSFFKELISKSMIFILLLVAIFLMSVVILQDDYKYIFSRLPELDVLLFLGVVTIANAFIFSIGAYLRVFNIEPMMNVSIVMAILSIFNIIIFSSSSITTLMMFYAIIVVFIGVPWTILVLKRIQKSKCYYEN